MTNITSNKPNASKLLESLRSSGYDNYSALADLIDNSFDANADNIKVSIGDMKDGDYLITLADNGDGMNEKTLSQALKLGSLTGQGNDSLGKYGMGLITASISFGRRLVVITKHEGKYLTGIHDLDEIAERNEFIKEIRESNDTEINTFINYLGSVVSGTLVLIQKIDNLQNKNLTSFSNTLTKHCAEIFRDFLEANKVLTINRKLVLLIDPMMRKDSGTIELIDKSKEFINELGEKSSIRLRIYHLPNFPASENKERKININNQGFYLMRNNRQVAGGEDLKIFSKHNDYNRFRAELYFDGSLDKMIGINFRKQNITLFDEVRQWIESVTTHQLVAIRDTAKQNQKKNRESKLLIDHTPTQRVVASRKSVLKKPKVSEYSSIPSLKNIDPDDFANVMYSEHHNTHLAPLFQIGIDGEAIDIKWNADHVFYETIFIGSEENKELINAIDALVYSMSLALIGITSSEKNIALKDEFLDNMSDNLRTLLS